MIFLIFLVIDDATKEIVYRDYVDISIAVATPRGLVVPVLRNCEAMNYKQIEIEMNELAAKVCWILSQLFYRLKIG